MIKSDKTVQNGVKLTELTSLTLTTGRLSQGDSPKEGTLLCATLSLISLKTGHLSAPHTSLIVPKEWRRLCASCSLTSGYNPGVRVVHPVV